MTAVQSSQVAGVGYNPATQDLAIEYTSGGVYTYHGVAAEVHTDMMESESIGRFVNQAVKPVYVSTRPDGSTCPPTVPKAAKASGNGKPAAAPAPKIDAPAAPAPKATNALPQADEPYTHEQLVADLQAANVLLAGFVPATISNPMGLEWLAGALAACDDELIHLEAEYRLAADEVTARRNALRRYFEPQARQITEQTVAVLGGARKSIDTPIPGHPGQAMRWGLTTQPARLQLEDPEAAKAWAKTYVPEAVVAVPARTIPATEALTASVVTEYWKENGPALIPDGFVLIPESQKFSYKPVSTGKEG
jgi:hypothetical protein